MVTETHTASNLHIRFLVFFSLDWPLFVGWFAFLPLLHILVFVFETESDISLNTLTATTMAELFGNAGAAGR